MAMTIKRIGIYKGFVAAGLALGAAAPTIGQATDAAPQKQAPPPGSAPKAFTVPAHETYSLPNGMKVTLVPYGNIPKVTVSLAPGAAATSTKPATNWGSRTLRAS